MANKLQNTSVSNSIAELYLQDELADVEFSFKKNGTTQTLPAHKIIMASGSPVFKTMFFGSLPEKKVVDIVDASPGAFKEFLQFFYLSEVTLTMENTEEVARLADKYDMLNCMNTCATFLERQLTNSNMFWGYQLAISLNNQRLKKFCEDKIVYLTDELFKSSAFLNCGRKVVNSILQMDELVCNEHNVFIACMEWAKTSCRNNNLNEKDPANLKKQLGECFYLIRFGQLKPEEIGEIMTNKLYSGMFSREELLEVTCATTAKNFQLKTFNSKPRLNVSFERNSNPILICSCGVGRNCFRPEAVRNQSYVAFSSNVPVVLGGILGASIRDNRRLRGSVTFSITIFEKVGLSSLHPTTGKILFTGEVRFTQELSTPKVNITPVIVVKPTNMYTICFECTTNILSDVYYSAFRKNVVTLDGNIEMNFYNNNTNLHNPIYNDYGSLVSELHFKRV